MVPINVVPPLNRERATLVYFGVVTEHLYGLKRVEILKFIEVFCSELSVDHALYG